MFLQILLIVFLKNKITAENNDSSIYGYFAAALLKADTNNNTTTIKLSGNNSGYAVVAKGGHLIANEDLTTHNEIVSGSSSYTIIHNLIEEYPLVQAWNTFTKRQEQPSIVESINENSLSITFAGIFNGKIIIKK